MSTKQTVSPLPGVFYRRPAPDKPEFKSEGDRVEAGDVIGLVEVMKSFHEVKAGDAGTVARFLIENESPVMAGQPILDIEP